MADVMSQAITGLIIIMGIVISLLVGWFVVLNTKFKYRVRVRKIVKGRTIIIDDRARLFKDKWKVEWWKLKKLKSQIPVPPSDTIDITAKGKMCCEYYLTEDGAYIPIKDDLDFDKLKYLANIVVAKQKAYDVAANYYSKLKAKQKNKEKLDVEEQKFFDDYKDVGLQLNREEAEAYAFMSEFKPLTTQERALMTHEHSKALEYNKKKGLNEILATALMFGVPVLIIVMLLIFAPDIIESTGVLIDKLDNVATNLDKTAQELANTKAGIVELQSETTTPTVPN